MRKKSLLIVLGAIIAASLSSCGSPDKSPTKQPVSVSEKYTETKDNKTESETIREETKSEEIIAPTSETEELNISLPEQEIYNQDGLIVTVKGFESDGLSGPQIKLLLENNGDKNVTIQPRNSSINGYMMDFQMSCDVAAGKKANDSINISSRDLEECSIETIANIEFSLHIFGTDGWDTINDSDIITLKTTGNEKYIQNYDDSGDILYDENNIRIISKGLVNDGSFMGPECYFYIENNSDSGITIQQRNTSVNGFMIDASMSCDVLPGKKAIDSLTFFSSDMEKNNIENIEEIETSFHIFQLEGYETIADTAPIVMTFE